MYNCYREAIVEFLDDYGDDLEHLVDYRDLDNIWYLYELEDWDGLVEPFLNNDLFNRYGLEPNLYHNQEEAKSTWAASRR